MLDGTRMVHSQPMMQPTIQIDTHLQFSDIYPNPQDLKTALIHACSTSFRRTLERDRIALRFLAIEQVGNPTILALKESKERLSREAITDYLTISYCWSNCNDEKHPIQIRQLDGSLRAPRAPTSVLRRAIAHARAAQKNIFWVDQECIEQGDAVEKANTIDVMDIIYCGASEVIGLLNLVLTDQKHVDALKLLDCSGFYSLEGAELVGAAVHVTKVLELIARDPYFTRAWIMQERLCANNECNNSVWINCTPGLNTRIGGNQIVTEGEILFDIKHSTGLVKELIRRVADIDAAASHRLKTVFSDLLEKFTTIDGAMNTDKRGYIRRSSLVRHNLMQSLQFLHDKRCLIESDKLSICANACNYPYRATSASMSLSLWAMALLNGDVSILRQQGDRCLGWLPSQKCRLNDMTHSRFKRTVSMRATDAGLETVGWVWKYSSWIDLAELKDDIILIKERYEQELNAKLAAESDSDSNYHKSWARTECDLAQLRSFFWLLLKKLNSTGCHAVADVIWQAVKDRGYSSEHDSSSYDERTVSSIHFSSIVDPQTGRCILTEDSYGTDDRWKATGAGYDGVHEDKSTDWSSMWTIGEAKGVRSMIEHDKLQEASESQDEDKKPDDASIEHVEAKSLADERVQTEDSNRHEEKSKLIVQGIGTVDLEDFKDAETGDDNPTLEVPSDRTESTIPSQTPEDQEVEEPGEADIHAIFGKLWQLKELQWIRSSILDSGGLWCGTVQNPTGVEGDQIVISDNTQNNGGVFVMYNSYPRQRWGRLTPFWTGPLGSPWDVWNYQPMHVHESRPYAWSGKWEASNESGSGSGFRLGGNCNVLFDVDAVALMELCLLWPEQFKKSSWNV